MSICGSPSDELASLPWAAQRVAPTLAGSRRAAAAPLARRQTPLALREGERARALKSSHFALEKIDLKPRKVTHGHMAHGYAYREPRNSIFTNGVAWRPESRGPSIYYQAHTQVGSICPHHQIASTCPARAASSPAVGTEWEGLLWAELSKRTWE